MEIGGGTKYSQRCACVIGNYQDAYIFASRPYSLEPPATLGILDIARRITAARGNPYDVLGVNESTSNRVVNRSFSVRLSNNDNHWW